MRNHSICVCFVVVVVSSSRSCSREQKVHIILCKAKSVVHKELQYWLIFYGLNFRHLFEIVIKLIFNQLEKIYNLMIIFLK